MSRPRGYGVLLALAALLWAACGRGESGAAAQDRAVATSTPGAAAPPTAQPAPSPAGSTPDASQTTAFDPDAAYDKGAALAVARRFAEARQAFAEAARRAPLDGSLSAAVAMFDDLAGNRISEDVVQRLFQAGADANAERWAEAHADVDEAIRLAPRYARAYGLRGTLYLQQAKREEALEAFGQAVTLDPTSADGYHNRGATHAALDQHDEAVADYTRAIELRSDFWDAYMNRGSALTQRGLARLSKPDLLAAMADHTKAHELNPGAAEPLYRRGELYALAEQWNEAKADFTAAIDLDRRRNGAGETDLVRLARQHLQAIEKAQKD
jgi:tetratricopeptide (TPR) repeat protein